MENSITILSVNCQGLHDYQKRRDVFHFLRNKQHCIYFLQDIHFQEKREKQVLAEWGYQAYFSSYTSNARGVGILFNNNFEFKIKQVIKDISGNYIMLLIESFEKDFLLVNVYGPNRDNPDFYINLKEQIQNLGIENVIIGGDFNLVLDAAKDYHNYKHVNNPKAKEEVENMIEDLELNDIWRELNPDSLRYTWRRVNPLQQARLDFFLISDPIVTYVDYVDIECSYRSDHSSILLKLKLNENTKHKTFWKFNASLLKDKLYADEINSEIRNIVQEYAINDNTNDIRDEDLVFSVDDDIFL